MTKWIILALVIIAIGVGAYFALKSNGQDTSKINEEKEKLIDTVVSEVEKINERQLEIYRELAKNKESINEVKKGRVEIEKAKGNIVVPGNLRDLADAFNKRGFRASARVVLPSR